MVALFLILILISGVGINAQTASTHDFVADTNELKNRYYGLLGGGGSFNYGSFPGIPLIPNCCTEFTGAVGLSWQVAAGIDIPFNYYNFATIHLGISGSRVNFVEQEKIDLMVDGRVQAGAFEHRLNTNITNIFIDPLYTRRIKDNIFVHGGISLSLPISTNFSQIEVVSDPKDRGVFPLEQKSFRNDTAGNINGISSMLFGLAAGISAEFPLVKDRWLMIMPFAKARIYLNSNISPGTWNTFTLDGGVAIKYRKPPVPPPPPPPPANPPFPSNLPMPKEPPVLKAEMRAEILDTNLIPLTNPIISIEDFVSFNLKPLLNYVFFEENSSELSSRYVQLSSEEKTKFTFTKLQKLDDVQSYYNVLNIVGKRLSEDTLQTITLVGCNTNEGDEKNNKELSRLRATTVRNYLRDTWGINEKRMRVQARNLPQEASKSDTITGLQENRRVEILANDGTISQPITNTDTLRQIQEVTIRFYPKVDASVQLNSWKIRAGQGNNLLFEKSGEGDLPKSIDWKLTKKEAEMMNRDKIAFYLEVSDKIGNKVKSEKQNLKVEQLTVDKKRGARIKDTEYENYSLILFDYGKTALANEHKQVVDYVKSRIVPGAKVKVLGYTDAKGDDAVNMRIATARAKAVAERLNMPNVEYKGIGEQELLFDNTYPEGRFYCRTVRILVETEVE